MHDIKQISPLLDNYIIGEPMSDHHGINCCPAINKENENRYILKIISVPASQTQLDALLLTGAVDSPEAAMEYFEKRANDYIQEIDILNNLSRFEGFLPCSGYQTVPKDQGTGFDIYILSEYRRSLERQFTKKPFTQLDALNLGLDICSALTACRRNGYIFVNLKPSNIFVAESGEYKISDLGFVKLNNLKYATIPDHFIGEYTAPEITDPFSMLNEQIDVYAVGMILYRIYNGGILPDASANEFPPPAYADSELAQIILKACCAVPEERWADPAQMGQMLVSYMQKNGVSDTLIVPPTSEPVPEIENDELADAADTEIAVATDTEIVESTDIILDNALTAEESTEAEHAASGPVQSEICAQTEQLSIDDYVAQDTDSSNEEAAAEPADSSTNDTNTVNTPVCPEAESSQSCAPICEDAPGSEPAEEPTQYEGVSDEVNEILSMADSLAAMEIPKPVVAPEAKEITLSDWDKETDESVDAPDEIQEEEPQMEYYVDIPEQPKKTHWVRNLVLILLVLGLLVGGFLFYKLYVLQTVDNLVIDGHQDQLTVRVDADIDEALLYVSCTKAGTVSITVPVTNGEAKFSGLEPNSEYNIEIKISGLHILAGETTYTYYSPHKVTIEKTEVLNGHVAGNAVLIFDIMEDIVSDSISWKFTYSCPGAESRTEVFHGTTLTLTDLTEGKVYTGLLEPAEDAYICEAQQIVFTPSEIIKANDLMITSCTDGKLIAQWEAPESVKVDSWTVKCYNGSDYDKTITTSATSAEFTELNSANGFTVEVTAAGQSLKQTATVGANSITVSNISAETLQPGVIDLTWTSSAVPANGWIITYDVSGCESVVRVSSQSNTAQIKPVIPKVTYSISIRSADTVQTLCADYEYQTPEAQAFTAPADNHVKEFIYSLCKQPAEANWTYDDVATYTTSFELSEDAGMIIYLDGTYQPTEQEVSVAFVIRDSDEQLISIDSASLNWNSMWIDRHCHLNIPKLPDAVGNYTVTVYFNGSAVADEDFTVK